MCQTIIDPVTGEAVLQGEVDPLFPLLPSVLLALRQRESALPSVALSASVAELTYSAVQETICGPGDESQDVEQYDGTLGVNAAFVDTHQAMVGQVQWNSDLAARYQNPGNVSGQRWCSGVLIADDLFLTASHCFDRTSPGWQRPRTNGTTQVISEDEIARNMHVNFNYQFDPLGNPRPEARYAITELVENKLNGLDFAIIRLSGSPGARWGRARLALKDAAARDGLCIIGHPAGFPKRIEAGSALSVTGTTIRYNDIDTLGGNSGSGILHASDGSIVGVHTNGGCTSLSPAGGGSNFGVRVGALLNASPTLRQLAGA